MFIRVALIVIPSILWYTHYTGSRQSRVHRKEANCNMANSNEKASFPKDSAEALAMLYVHNQDISDLTPEELFKKYNDAYHRIKECADNSNNWGAQS